MNRRNNVSNSNLSWDGRSFFWPRMHRERIPGGDSNLWMCAQDLGSCVWAQFRRAEQLSGQQGIEHVRLENCSSDLQRILTNALPFNQYREDLHGALCNFSKMVAQEFVLRGEIIFEVRGGWNRATSPATLEAATVVSIPTGSVHHLGPWAFQLIPSEVRATKEVGRVVRLDGSHLVAFSPPRRWRGELSCLRAGLPVVGKLEHEWMMSIGRLDSQEDFKAIKLAHSIQRARLTASIGWNARGLLRDHISDFHWMVRELRWKRFCIEVRNEILSTVSEMFSIIGSWKDEHPQLVTELLPTLQQVKDSEDRLMGKGARFDELLEPFKI